jgi:hypothetical protein
MDAAAVDAFWDGLDKGDVERRARNVAKSSEAGWSFNGGTLAELFAGDLRALGQTRLLPDSEQEPFALGPASRKAHSRGG